MVPCVDKLFLLALVLLMEKVLLGRTGLGFWMGLPGLWGARDWWLVRKGLEELGLGEFAVLRFMNELVLDWPNIIQARAESANYWVINSQILRHAINCHKTTQTSKLGKLGHKLVQMLLHRQLVLHTVGDVYCCPNVDDLRQVY